MLVQLPPASGTDDTLYCFQCWVTVPCRYSESLAQRYRASKKELLDLNAHDLPLDCRYAQDYV